MAHNGSTEDGRGDGREESGPSEDGRESVALTGGQPDLGGGGARWEGPGAAVVLAVVGDGMAVWKVGQVVEPVSAKERQTRSPSS